MREFRKQFKAKAGVDWNNRHGMVAGKGRLSSEIYVVVTIYPEFTREISVDRYGTAVLSAHTVLMLEIERVFEDEEEKKDDDKPSGSAEEPEKIPDSTLPLETQVGHTCGIHTTHGS